MGSRAEVYVGVELYDLLSDKVTELEREHDRRVTFREAIVACLDDQTRQRFEQEYRQTDKEKYER